MANHPDRPRVTIWLDVLLLLYLGLLTCARYLFEPPTPAPVDAVFERSFLLGVALALGLMIALLLGGTLLVRSFWNAFVSDVFGVRPIGIAEAAALTLIGTIVLGAP
jgi:hypothetical protein